MPREATDPRWFMTNTTITILMSIEHFFFVLDYMCGLSLFRTDFTTVPHDADRRGNWSCGKGRGVSGFFIHVFFCSIPFYLS